MEVRAEVGEVDRVVDSVLVLLVQNTHAGRGVDVYWNVPGG